MNVVFPYIVKGGEDAMKLDAVASSGLNVRLAFVLMIGLDDQPAQDVVHAEAEIEREEEIVFALIETVAKALDADVHSVEDMGTPVRTYASIAEFRQHRLSPWEDDSAPLHVPSFIRIRREGIITGMMVCEGWFNVGGPWPYHDSYTYATYLEDEVAREHILVAIPSMCDHLGLATPELVVLP